MAYILVDRTGLCFCDCGDTCLVQSKSGSQNRCTIRQIEDVGHTPVQVANTKSIEVIRALEEGDKIKVKVKKKTKKTKKIDYSKISSNPEVIELLKERVEIEQRIKKMDETALISYELEVL